MQELLKPDKPLPLSSLTEPVVLCAADDNYVKPLAVTLCSAAHALKPGRQLQIILMDGGISEVNWQGLKESLAGLPLSISVIKPNREELADLGISHHITHTAYFRLLAARLLPKELDKVIYLDSDLLVKEDITELWEQDVSPYYCLAAVDVACPFIDAYQADPCFRKSIPYLASTAPIPNWKELGIDPLGSYFNSGVMVLNLKRWREETIEIKLLKCLRDNASSVWCWDQYALNVVFAGQWGKLPPRWNQGAHVFEFPGENHSPIDPTEFKQMRDRPALIHYTTEFKPWNYRPFHPLRDSWFLSLDQTAWANWRPQEPAFSFKSSVKDGWTRQAVYWTRQCIIHWRKLKLCFHSSLNLHAEGR